MFPVSIRIAYSRKTGADPVFAYYSTFSSEPCHLWILPEAHQELHDLKGRLQYTCQLASDMVIKVFTYLGGELRDPTEFSEYRKKRSGRKPHSYMCPLSSTSKYVNPRSECIVPSAPTPSTMKLSSSIGVWKPCFPFPFMCVVFSILFGSVSPNLQVMLRNDDRSRKIQRNIRGSTHF